MYVTAVIKNRKGELITVKATAGCDVIFPMSIADRLKYALATNKLLAEFMAKIKPYANKDHAIVEVQTDNFIVMDRLSKEYQVHYIPEIEDGGETIDV
ncbi:MAG: hypothetical protein QXQ64_02370 [Candidatus Bathyarchaeia archaeon]